MHGVARAGKGLNGRTAAPKTMKASQFFISTLKEARAGAVELLMPVVQPAEYWQETGRWEKMGPELMRVKDRHGRDFIIQPTSEEVVTDIARQELRSYKPVSYT